MFYLIIHKSLSDFGKLHYKTVFIKLKFFWSQTGNGFVEKIILCSISSSTLNLMYFVQPKYSNWRYTKKNNHKSNGYQYENEKVNQMTLYSSLLEHNSK